ncbi:MAG: proton-conducting transporter membrane subunit [Pseudothermotoga sp.]|uniref:proton-conducting transporter transmembrane domain-containing protein n=1 Tax=Pseudothermotoga sp. TaxID=2033661 RepID=UPI0025838078|nr:proton-conducting transporter membrane subunit [Pseudothermotoga sp.]MDI6862564.1 proton-conducting transporter membrane subunit [Pseudothermotoga sp.]
MLRFYLLYNFALFGASVIFFSKSLLKIATLSIGFVNLALANYLYFGKFTDSLTLRYSFGVKLVLDSISTNFLLMNAVVWLAAAFVAVRKDLRSFYYTLLIMFLATCNLAFVSNDLFNIYVTLELAALLTFLLSFVAGKTIQFWAAIKYLLLCSAAMQIYLIGVILHFGQKNSFEIAGQASSIVAVLLICGVLMKAGVFFYSMWLPDLHANVEPEVSTLLSGVSIKTGVYAILRLSAFLGDHYTVVVVFGILTALGAVVFAMNERHYKRILAYHTLSQVGYMLVSPTHGAAYALAHGVFKGFLFLLSDDLPTYDTKELKRNGIGLPKWFFLALASLSISGFPYTIGGAAKDLVFGTLKWQKPFMYVAAVGTVMSFAKFLFMVKPRFEKVENLPSYLLFSLYCLLPILGFGKDPVKSLIVFGVGILSYLIVKDLLKPLPRTLETLENSSVLYVLVMALVLVVVMVGG